MLHCQDDLANHVTGMRSYDGRPELREFIRSQNNQSTFR